MTKIKFIHLLVFIAMTSHHTNLLAQFQTGCLKEDYTDSLVRKTNLPNSRGSLPTYYTLESYIPQVGNQGNLGSCTSWACAYAGMTISRRLQEANPYLAAYNPLNLHNRLKASYNLDPCSDGNTIRDALQMLKTYGCEKYSYSNLDCKYIPASNYYSDKLFDFDQLTISVSNFKNALNENNPIVICMTSYINGWNNSNNLPNGIWNGHQDGESGKYHAMCIIGYDDNKDGGAFKVMNSWGNSYGNNGFFWLRYRNIYSITHAFNLKLEDNDNNFKQGKGEMTAKYFRIYNPCYINTYIAITKKVNGQWKSEGWYPVKPSGYYDYYIGDRETEEIYWIAISEGKKFWWYSTISSGRSFCYDRNLAFTNYEYDNCGEKINYHYFNPESHVSGNVAIETTECVNQSSSRGASNSANQPLSNYLFDGRGIDSANKFWRKGYLLMDYYTNRLIMPEKSDDQDPKYNIWFVDNKNKLINSNFTAAELEKINYFKFASKESAEAWKNSLK